MGLEARAARALLLRIAATHQAFASPSTTFFKSVHNPVGGNLLLTTSVLEKLTVACPLHLITARDQAIYLSHFGSYG